MSVPEAWMVNVGSSFYDEGSPETSGRCQLQRWEARPEMAILLNAQRSAPRLGCFAAMLHSTLQSPAFVACVITS